MEAEAKGSNTVLIRSGAQQALEEEAEEDRECGGEREEGSSSRNRGHDDIDFQPSLLKGLRWCLG